MPARPLDLATFNDQLLDGLEFCGKVYDFFDQTQRGPEGIRNLRLRSTKNEKRLLEELIPLARYVQNRYREGRRIKVRWFSGSQRYDAILWSSGGYVAHGMAPRRQLVEVTTAVSSSAHLSRELLDKTGSSWGAKRIARDRKTNVVTAKPYVYANDERVIDLRDQVLDGLRQKSAKNYPKGLVLIINCESEGLLLEGEWQQAVKQIEDEQQHLGFREVFLVETSRGYSATLYGNRTGGRRLNRRGGMEGP